MASMRRPCRPLVPNLSIVPSTLDLLGVEMEIGRDSDRAFRLRRALASDEAQAFPTSWWMPALLQPSDHECDGGGPVDPGALQCEFFAWKV